jgi:hypothetical protein
MERKLQLSYNTEWQRFVLRDELAAKDDWGSFEMVINCGWDGEKWYHYDFVCWFAGEAHGVCTNAQFKERVQEIEMHEGPEAAAIWHQRQEQVVVVRNNHPVFKLQAQWEAMETLGLFCIPVDMFGKGFRKELYPDIREAMDAARERYFNEGLDAMDQSEGAVQ